LKPCSFGSPCALGYCSPWTLKPCSCGILETCLVMAPSRQANSPTRATHAQGDQGAQGALIARASRNPGTMKPYLSRPPGSKGDLIP
jgi:hypothetical protein